MKKTFEILYFGSVLPVLLSYITLSFYISKFYIWLVCFALLRAFIETRLRDTLRKVPATCVGRHDAAADLIHLYAYTKYFFTNYVSCFSFTKCLWLPIQNQDFFVLSIATIACIKARGQVDSDDLLMDPVFSSAGLWDG